MAVISHTNSLRGLVRGIVDSAGGRASRPPLRDAEDFLLSLARLDYAAPIRKRFDRQQLHKILGEMRAALPALNVDVFRARQPPDLAKIAHNLGVIFHATPLKGPTARTLRGFYVRPVENWRKPLVCINTATHPVAAAAAFWHEIGHHLTDRIFDDRHQLHNLSFRAGYESHLDSPLEIAADMLMVLAGYPRSAAQALFTEPLRRGLVPRTDELLSKARAHLHTISGFEFHTRFPAIENLHYLAGMIYYSKFRWVLFSEYEI